MVIAFYIAAIKLLMGRLFSSVIMYKIIRQMWRAIIRDASDKVWVLLPLIDMEKQTGVGVWSSGRILNEGNLNISCVSWDRRYI